MKYDNKDKPGNDEEIMAQTIKEDHEILIKLARETWPEKTPTDIEKELRKITKPADSRYTQITTPLTGSLAKKPQSYMKVGIHALGQFYNNPRQTEIFSQDKINEIIRETGQDSKSPPEKYGVELNTMQGRVLEAVWQALTETNYRGDYQESPEKKTQNLDIKGRKLISKQYEYIDAIPIIQISQANLIRKAGLDPRKQGDKQHTQKALNYLATERFCFFWQRAVKDSKGKIQKDKAGKWKKEDVMEVGTFLRVKYVKKPGSDKLDYYEIQFSPVMLDQINSYFVMIPYTWRKEVEQIMGKNVSKYTYFFLEWLRLQFELIRRKNNSPYRIKKTWEELADTLKMPKSLYRAKKKTAISILNEAYTTAIKLGYLDKVDNTGAVHTFYLNENHYHKPTQLNP